MFSEQHHSGTHTGPKQLSAGRASHSSPEQFFLVTFTLLQTPRFSGEVAAGLGCAGGAVLTSSASSCQQGAPSGAVAAGASPPHPGLEQLCCRAAHVLGCQHLCVGHRLWLIAVLTGVIRPEKCPQLDLTAENPAKRGTWF